MCPNLPGHAILIFQPAALLGFRNRRAAMIDRLTHQAYIVNMIGASYRMKETEKWLQEQSLLQEQPM
ncbi:hypothetical protein SAMN05428981_10110 [Bacillus sp. OV194]|nr:hypothetical protein SAMN05428981_10110 [Bacillus sp. OV194]